MNSVIEVIIYFVAVLGIFLTYMSIKSYDEVYGNVNEYRVDNSDMKRIDLVIKIKNYEEEEIEELVETIKYGKFNNLLDIVDNIKIEKD
ncbi:MAG: hypothetical protein Q4D02_03360 [Clostridia bacterium]|nr:hypothetical protein [Clostridia bacterium]